MAASSWHQGWDITDEEREVYRKRSQASSRAKAKAVRGEGRTPIHPINVPRLNPDYLMPQLAKNGLRSLSLFSGGGGLDLGFDRAGFTHVASYDILPESSVTLKNVRPEWKVFAGESGDVTLVNWRNYRGLVDIIHGGPPCQPFSVAGRHSRRSS
ncbi:DNA cytosine methyltransferase [Coleofasciculus sp. G2-EDA-02]|uniref:DNA cytosine methyltransferase n=1 Tax=Coleofasciculus sp. G2-EDA-02 TaxID=3069529 RepID=UPI0032F3ED6B